MLLPLQILREGVDGALIQIQEPTLVHGRGDPQLMADLLTEQLQQGIEAAGAQWLLLPTLTFESTESA